ncbi:hypothetical protein BD289DRAFT_14297 [Coniella lustricola]|uniref:Uncharacterized protein n=1 Tax=Coniella lustricola TaxID=2025994 RepID=A0A2T3A419_9PEZI|nr:hypothetical protein BD289DRAFT_14297 [Coniella lustricola]
MIGCWSREKGRFCACHRVMVEGGRVAMSKTHRRKDEMTAASSSCITGLGTTEAAAPPLSHLPGQQPIGEAPVLAGRRPKLGGWPGPWPAWEKGSTAVELAGFAGTCAVEGAGSGSSASAGCCREGACHVFSLQVSRASGFAADETHDSARPRVYYFF